MCVCVRWFVFFLLRGINFISVLWDNCCVMVLYYTLHEMMSLAVLFLLLCVMTRFKCNIWYVIVCYYGFLLCVIRQCVGNFEPTGLSEIWVWSYHNFVPSFSSNYLEPGQGSSSPMCSQTSWATQSLHCILGRSQDLLPRGSSCKHQCPELEVLDWNWMFPHIA